MARTTTEHQIIIQAPDPHSINQLERVGSARITPGMLLKNNGGSMIIHPTAGSFLPGKLVALTNRTADTDASPTSAAVDIPYKVGDTVYYIQAGPGYVCNMLLGTDSGSATATEGVSVMVSDGGGGVIVGSGSQFYDDEIVGVAAEDVNNSGETTRVRLKVRIT